MKDHIDGTVYWQIFSLYISVEQLYCCGVDFYKDPDVDTDSGVVYGFKRGKYSPFFKSLSAAVWYVTGKSSPWIPEETSAASECGSDVFRRETDSESL